MPGLLRGRRVQNCFRVADNPGVGDLQSTLHHRGSIADHTRSSRDGDFTGVISENALSGELQVARHFYAMPFRWIVSGWAATRPEAVQRAMASESWWQLLR